MTDKTPKHSNPHIDALPGAVGTHALYAGIAGGINALLQLRGGRGVWKALGALKKHVRGLYKLERKNFEAWLRSRLQRDHRWRESVLEDLGGERALRRWERRAAQAQVNVQPAETRTVTRRPRAGKNAHAVSSGYKTDEQGLFRLAVIQRLRPTVRRTRVYAGGLRCGGGLFPLPGPIGVTPDELRGTYGVATGQAVIETRYIAPFDLWASLLSPVMNAFNYLMDIELDLVMGRTPSIGESTINTPRPSLRDKADAIADHSVTHPT